MRRVFIWRPFKQSCGSASLWCGSGCGSGSDLTLWCGSGSGCGSGSSFFCADPHRSPCGNLLDFLEVDILWNSFAVPHHVNADLVPTYHFDAGPDADPDSDFIWNGSGRGSGSGLSPWCGCGSWSRFPKLYGSGSTILSQFSTYRLCADGAMGFHNIIL